MTHRERRRSWCTGTLILAVVLFGTSAHGRPSEKTGEPRWLPFVGGVEPGTPPKVVLLHSDFERIEVALEFYGCWAIDVSRDEGEFTRLYGPGFGQAEDLGRPALPVRREWLDLPYGAEVKATVLEAESKDYYLKDLALLPLYPAQPFAPKNPELQPPFAYDKKYYGSAPLSPETPLALDAEQSTRGHRLLPVTTWPVAYDPPKGVVRLFSKMVIRLDLRGADPEWTHANWDRYRAGQFEHRLADSVLNFQLPEYLEDLVTLRFGVPYLILVGDAGLLPALQPFVTLKQQQGFKVTVEALTDFIPDPGALTELELKVAIRNRVMEHYYDCEEPPPVHLLLVGDTDTIPCWWGDERPAEPPPFQSYHCTDLYYACMEDVPDWHPDLTVGRFPVREVGQLDVMVNKYVNYAALAGDEDWLKRAGFIATCDVDHVDTAEGSHDTVIADHTEPNGYSGQFPNVPQPGGDQLYCVRHGADEPDIAAAMNDGRWALIFSGHGNYDGWGNLHFTRDDVEALESPEALGFVASFACYTGFYGKPYVDQAFGETWVLEPESGAVAFWGASYDSGWPTDDVHERVMFDHLFAALPFADPAGQPALTAATDAGLWAIENQINPTSAIREREKYNLMGDPAFVPFLQTWDQLVAGDFGGEGHTDLFAYDRDRGEGFFFLNDGNDGFTLAARLPNLGTDWDRIVAGEFSGDDSGSEIALYSAASGVLSVFLVDLNGPAPLILMDSASGVGGGWDLMDAGSWGMWSDDYVLLYDDQDQQGSGITSLYITRNDDLSFARTQTGHRNTWSAMAAGQFIGGATWHEVLFYDNTVGEAGVFAWNSLWQTLYLSEMTTGIGTKWDALIAGHFDNNATYDDAFFYDAASGIGRVYRNDGTGKLLLLKQNDHLGRGWDLVLAGDFGGDSHTDVLFYDLQSGEGAVLLSDGLGNLAQP